jgi:hypothetical protein
MNAEGVDAEELRVITTPIGFHLLSTKRNFRFCSNAILPRGPRISGPVCGSAFKARHINEMNFGFGSRAGMTPSRQACLLYPRDRPNLLRC